MKFTEFKMDKAKIAERIGQMKANLKALKGAEDLVGNAKKVIEAALADNPLGYLEYGPYWWALKEALFGRGAVNPADAEVAAEYRGETPEETVVMADTFARFVFEAGNYFPTSRTWVLSPEETGEEWTLFDSEMEGLAAMGVR